MFLAALISLSCVVLQAPQVHSLIAKPALPFGLLFDILKQHEQVWVVKLSFTSSNRQPACLHL